MELLLILSSLHTVSIVEFLIYIPTSSTKSKHADAEKRVVVTRGAKGRGKGR